MMNEPVSELFVTKSLAMNWDKIGAIVGISGKYIGTIFRIKPNQKIYIGRDPRETDFVLDDDSISRIHCWIEYDADQNCYHVCDCSTNGIFVNQKKRMEKNVVTDLYTGDELRMAKTAQVFKLG